jgi:hypothetical protein
MVSAPVVAYPLVVSVTRLLAASVLLVIGLGAGTALGGRSASSTRTLRPDGIETVRFGVTKRTAVTELRRLFGTPSARGINTGCGPPYTEVEWGDLVAEFRLSRFSGFRYLKGGWPLTTPGSPREASPPKTAFPKLATTKGISLGSTLAQLRGAYRPLRSAGTDKWRAANGLTFVVNAKHDPEPSSSRIIEIKVGTCGDF